MTTQQTRLSQPQPAQQQSAMPARARKSGKATSATAPAHEATQGPGQPAKPAKGRRPRASQPLDARQRRFVDEYLVDLSPSRAAIRAGYPARNASITGRRLLRNTFVITALREAQDARAFRTGITQDMVLRELAAVGFTVMTDICAWAEDGVRLRPSQDLSRVQAAAVAEIKEAGTGKAGVQLKLHSKLKALEMLGRHLGMFSGPADADLDNDDGKEGATLPPDLKARLDAIYAARDACTGTTDTAAADTAP